MGAVKVLGTPAGKGSGRALMRGGRAVILPDNSTALGRWTRSIRAGVQALLDAGHGPYDGPVAVTVTFTLPRPASAPLRRRPWPHRRGLDLDKGLRALGDAIQGPGRLIGDDSQIVRLVATKCYPDTPGVPDRLDQPGALIRIGEAMPGRDLTTFARWCRQHADQPDADPLWDLLAREVEAYLAGDPSVIAPEPLPDHDDQDVLL